MKVIHTLLGLWMFSTLTATEPIVGLNKVTDKIANKIPDKLADYAAGRRDLKTTITEDVLEDVFRKCETTLKARIELEARLSKKGRVIKMNDRQTDLSLIRMRKMDPTVRYREMCHFPFDEATHQLHLMYNLTSEEINEMLPNLALQGKLGSSYRDNCTRAIVSVQCDENARYRRIDGQCNNLQNPTWGSAMSCQQRLMPAYYVGNSGYRESVRGGTLPDPRNLSNNLHFHMNRPTNYVTHMYMFFGQLLDHDMTLTPTSTTADNEGIQCCPPEEATHPQCQPIIIGSDDQFYSQFGIRCLNFVRSAPCATCGLGPRQLMNQITAFIDASFVYGNSENETASLRANDGTGRMRTEPSNYGDLLPSSSNPGEDQCSFPDTNDICFEAGDSRANQHTVLTSLHTVFLREHNRLAGELRAMNPQWDENRLFEEARRILGAQMQVITYKEYLPITLGIDGMSEFQLWMGHRTSYNSSLDCRLFLEFTTAAFRFGHSMINSVVTKAPPNNSNERRLLRNEFFQPFNLRREYVGPLLGGASSSPAQWFDRYLVPDVTNYLYRVRGDQTGLDLASININRGRDHGMPPYVDMVRFCSKYFGQSTEVKNFDDLETEKLMKREQANALRMYYKDVRDIYLWTGIVMETPRAGAVVGPTGACIIGMQFHSLKFGDRFYWEHYNVQNKFTYQQIKELSKMTLSKIFCLNTNVPQMALNAMLFSSRNNPIIQCQYVKGVDLSYWRE